MNDAPHSSTTDPLPGLFGCAHCDNNHRFVAFPHSFHTLSESVTLDANVNNKQETATKTTYIHNHFAFESKSEVEKLIILLASNSFGAQASAFLDEYFDTADGLLASNQAWLRKRDGHWLLTCAKTQSESNALLLEMFDSTPEITKKLESFGITEPVSTQDPHLKASLSRMARTAPILIRPFQRLCPCRIASMPTCRLTFTTSSKIGVTSLHIDTFLSNDHFYTAGSLMTTDKLNDDFLRLVGDHILIPAQEGPFFAFPQLSPPSNEWWPRSEFQGLPHPCIPYDMLTQSRDMAFEASLSLWTGYRAILEWEARREAEEAEEDEEEDLSYLLKSTTSTTVVKMIYSHSSS